MAKSPLPATSFVRRLNESLPKKICVPIEVQRERSQGPSVVESHTWIGEPRDSSSARKLPKSSSGAQFR